jgi:hypothetical protein
MVRNKSNITSVSRSSSKCLLFFIALARPVLRYWLPASRKQSFHRPAGLPCHLSHVATLPSVCGIGKRAATHLLAHKNRLQGRHVLSMMPPMTKLAEIQTAILQLEPTEREALRHWLDETEEETPEMLAAIDEGLRSLKGKGVIPLEDVRKQIPQWATKSA